MSDLAVEVHALWKAYGEIQAVDGIDLEVRKGEIFALIGPNGAGKTTTLEILEGYRIPDSGSVSVLGFDPTKRSQAFKERIGIVLQSASLPLYLRVEEAVDMFRGYYPNPRSLDDTIAVVGLQDQRRRLVRRLSGGQQRRLDVAIGIAGDPELLFLDEPTTGFDPSARRSAWEMIRGLKAYGKTILLTTHYMDEAQALADRVAIIVRGRIVAEGTPDELRARYKDTRIAFRQHIPADRRISPIPIAAESENGRSVIHTADPTKVLNELTTWAIENAVRLDDLTVSPVGLEEVYLRLSEGGAFPVESEPAPEGART
jgi:ABC-2 type transport system ATP-binding protein